MVTALGLVPLLAVGQTAFGSLSTAVGGQPNAVIQNTIMSANGQLEPDCTTNLVGTWTSALSGVPCSAMHIWVTGAAECQSDGNPGSTDVMLPDVPQSQFIGKPMQTGNVQFTVAQMVGAGAADGGSGTCGAGNFQSTFLLCASINMDTTTLCTTKQVVVTQFANKTAASIRYDTLAPDPPTLTAVESLDSALSVTYTVSANTDTTQDFVQVQFKLDTAPDTAWAAANNPIAANVSNQTINGLANGLKYDVRAVAIDAAKNTSGPSNVLTGTPVASSGFWGHYRQAGGEAQGCTTAPGVAVALALLWLRRRRS
jgi:hypothetical protein